MTRKTVCLNIKCEDPACKKTLRAVCSLYSGNPHGISGGSETKTSDEDLLCTSADGSETAVEPVPQPVSEQSSVNDLPREDPESENGAMHTSVSNDTTVVESTNRSVGESVDASEGSQRPMVGKANIQLSPYYVARVCLSLVVLYFSALLLLSHHIAPFLSTSSYVICLLSSIAAYTWHSFFAADHHRIMKSIYAEWLKFKKLYPLKATLHAIAKSIDALLRLPLILIHVGFESIIPLHGARNASTKPFVAVIVALSHAASELMAEYSSLFPHFQAGRKDIVSERSGVRWTNRLQVLLPVAFICYFLFASVAIAEWAPVGLGYYASSFYVATTVAAFCYAKQLCTMLDDLTNASNLVYRGSLLQRLCVQAISCFSGMALFCEYNVHLRMLIPTYITGSLAYWPISFLVATTSFIGSSLWSILLYHQSLGLVDSCCNSSESKESYIIATVAALTAGFIAAGEIMEFIGTAGFISGFTGAVMVASLAVLSAYVVDSAFFINGTVPEKLLFGKLVDLVCPLPSACFSKKSTTPRSSATAKANVGVLPTNTNSNCSCC